MTQSEWFAHTFRQRRFRPRNQMLALLSVGVFVSVLIGVIYLTQVASFATTNREIGELIIERDRLERANEQLRAEVASFRTVPRLLARAQELGYRPAQATDIEYLVVAGYDPSQRDLLVASGAASAIGEAAPAYDETFAGWLQQQLDGLLRQFDQFGQ
jgi:hypothetical protein